METDEARLVSKWDIATIEKAQDLWLQGKVAAAENLRKMENTTDDGGVKYKDRVSENDAIKTQLIESQHTLNDMDAVADVKTPLSFSSKKAAREWAIAELKTTGYRVDRMNFGVITFNAKQINKALNYLDDNEEFAAFAALPKVLKKGKEITKHDNHKGRGYGTVTIAAPVTINGIRGNMAVVVKKNIGDSDYRMHRILTPNGAKFSFDDISDIKKETATKPSGATTSAVAPTIGSVSNNNIPYASESVNTKFKLRSDSDYLSAVHSGDLSFDDFEIDLEEDDTISDIFAKDYAKHSEDIGEVLKNISDIEMDPKKVISFFIV